MIEIFQNIREIYDFRKPREELAGYIEFFSESSPAASRQYFTNGHAHARMFASYTPTFYINLGAPYSIDLDSSRFTVGAGEDILFLRNGMITRHILPTDRIFTVKFYPGGLEAVLGISQAGLSNRVISLHEALPAPLLTKMKQAACFEQRAIIIEEFLLVAQSQQTATDHYLKMVNDSIGEYQATGMQLNTSQVAERLFVNTKTINRYFHRVVGISPKAYFSILRARTALTAFIKDRVHFDPWTYGYYDFGHFSKEVIKFTGQRLREQQ